jgi:replication fork protection complex subunit Csm3/Swi3
LISSIPINNIQYSDASKLLSFYQLWLDDLFPKARFLDALAMIEKTGHKRIVQDARMGWINEGKPRASVHEHSLFEEPELPSMTGDQEPTVTRVAPIFERIPAERPKTPTADVSMDDDDLYNATPKAQIRDLDQGAETRNSIFGGSQGLFGPAKSVIDESIPEDDLDALLAEEEALHTASGNKQPEISGQKALPAEDNFDDEMEAMAEMEGMW